MKLRRDLAIPKKSAWNLAHRIRETWDRGESVDGGPFEVSVTYVGGQLHIAPGLRSGTKLLASKGSGTSARRR